MSVLTFNDVLETTQMITHHNLDVRTITMGISLRDCGHPDVKVCADKIYDKITKKAEKLVQTGEDIESDLGVPIINKRISVTPISMVGESCDTNDYVPLAKALDKAAHEVGVNFIGGFSALVDKGYTKGDRNLIASIPEALATTDVVCSSVNVGSTKAGINMDAVAEMGRVVKHALEAVRGQDIGAVAEVIKRTAFKITRVGQLVAQEAAKRLNTQFGIIDLSLAPTPAVGDSVAHILEEIGLESCGGPGTTATLAMLNDAVKKGGLMASSYVGGLSGAFIPVSEDAGMIAAVERGSLCLEKLEAMTCVCSVGLDMIAIPGDTTAETIAAIIADESAIGMINNKTTAVRVIPVPGKGVGETVEFGGLLGHAPIMAVSRFKADTFIARGGRIPAPVRSLTN